MTPPATLPLATARKYAEKIAASLLEELVCTRVEIAGSIRRGRDQVGDIDLVVTGCDAGVLRQRIARSCELVRSGDINIIAKLKNGFQLDIFIAHEERQISFFETAPSNWGTLLICRTGSKEHNIHLAYQAKAKGLHWDPYRGVIRPEGHRNVDFRDSDHKKKSHTVITGPVIASATEEEVFAAVGMEYLPPERRER